MKLVAKRISKNSTVQEKEIASIRKYFFVEINKQRFFLSKPLEFAKINISEDECWDKFAIGSVKDHRTRKLSINRIKRIHWITMLIDYITKNNYISPSTDITYNVSGNEHIIYVISEKYKVVIRESNNIMMVVTAFPENI